MSILVSRKYGSEYSGQTIVLPIVGESQFNDDGSLDIEDELVDALIEATKSSFDFAIQGSDEAKVTVSRTKGGKVLDLSEVDEDTKALIAELDNQTPEQLLELVKETKLDPIAASKMTSKKLKIALTQVLIEASIEEQKSKEGSK